ncbi:MAG: hypothetical protein VYB54_04575 [Pseudomonadota bacterium]|nr:hypothetical protein [Pseudomonadota bacterium]
MNPDPYSLSGPFYLNDRISPDGANDLDEVRRLDVALHARRGEAPPARVRPQSAVLEDLVHYQSLRGLKPDGAAAIDGPTALSLAADMAPDGLLQHAVHRLPLNGGVGAGEANRPGDVASARRGMALLGHYPPLLALDMLAPDPRLEPALQAFQAAHGLRPDGIMRPGGPTQLRAGQLLGARMTGLIGPDPSRPAAFSPRPQVPVVRQVPGMPDARAVPVSPGVPAATEEALHAVALSQAEAIRTRKAAAADDRMSGGAGDDSLSGEEAGDTLAGAGGTADDNRAHLIARFGGADATRPWARGADEAQGDWFRRLDGVMRHAADATTRQQIVDDARAALPTEPTERLAAEQGVRPDAWLLAEEAPEAEQKVYADWLAVPADRRPPLPETMEMLWFAGPDGRLYRRSDAVVDPARRAGIMQVERLEAMVEAGGAAAPSYGELFAAAAEEAMSTPPALGTGAADARARRGAATRRPRLETFAARAALPTPDGAAIARPCLDRRTAEAGRRRDPASARRDHSCRRAQPHRDGFRSRQGHRPDVDVHRAAGQSIVPYVSRSEEAERASTSAGNHTEYGKSS